MEIEEYERFLFVGGPVSGQRIPVLADQQEVKIPSQSFLGGSTAEKPIEERYRRMIHVAGPGAPRAFYVWSQTSSEDAISLFKALSDDVI